MQRELVAPDGVVGPREQRAVAADRVVADRVERVAGRELVAVEQDLLGRRHRALAARVDRVLLPGLEARVVPVAVVERPAPTRRPPRSARASRRTACPRAAAPARASPRRTRSRRSRYASTVGVLARVVAQPVVRIVAGAVRRRHLVRPVRGDRRHRLGGRARPRCAARGQARRGRRRGRRIGGDRGRLRRRAGAAGGGEEDHEPCEGALHPVRVPRPGGRSRADPAPGA